MQAQPPPLPYCVSRMLSHRVYDRTLRRRLGAWWPSRSSTPVAPSISARRVRFPSASADRRIRGGRDVDPTPVRCRGPTPCSPTRGWPPRSGRSAATSSRPRWRSAQERVREGLADPDEAVDAALAALPATARRPAGRCSTRPGVLVHTNLGRAPLSAAAVEAVTAAAGYADVEFDLAAGRRARRGRTALAALARRRARGARPCTSSTTTPPRSCSPPRRSPPGREIVISRGELVEIGDGFRLPDLLASTGARLREVGTTNRTALRDYADAGRPGHRLRPQGAPVATSGSRASPARSPSRTSPRLGPPVVADIGSGLLRPHPLLPDEPDAATALRDGAALVTASGDKLLGGPQAGLLLGRADLVERLRRHPLARALRVDKLTLAALEATLRGPRAAGAPVRCASSVAELRERACNVSRDGSAGRRRRCRPSPGSAAAARRGVELPSAGSPWTRASALRLRSYDPAVIGRITRWAAGARPACGEPGQDEIIAAAVEHVRTERDRGPGGVSLADPFSLAVSLSFGRQLRRSSAKPVR